MQPPQPPPAFTATPEGIIANTKTEIQNRKSLLDSLVKSVTPESATFANTIFPMEDFDSHTAVERMVYMLLSHVSPEASIRDAGREASKLTGDASAENLMRRDVAALVNSVWEKHLAGKEKLDTEDAWTLEKTWTAYKNAGAGIEDEAVREKYMKLHEESSAIALAAKKAFGDEDYGVWFTKEELEGVPESLLSKLQVNEGGKLKATFQKNTNITVMKYASRALTRKTLAIEREARFPENIERLDRIVQLRREMSHLLGFKSHAERKIMGRLAKSEEDVVNQLNQCVERAKDIRDAEYDRLALLKKEHLKTHEEEKTGVAEEDEGLNAWDTAFYGRLLEQEEYQLDATRLGEYFEVTETVKGVLAIYERLFQMRFEKVDIPTWHEDVQTYAVWNEESIGGEFLGYQYLDLYSRQGKPKGAFAGVIQPVRSNLSYE